MVPKVAEALGIAGHQRMKQLADLTTQGRGLGNQITAMTDEELELQVIFRQEQAPASRSR